MINVVKEIEDQEAIELAKLHKTAFPNEFLSLMSSKLLQRLYKEFSKNNSFFILYWVDDKIQGCCVLITKSGWYKSFVTRNMIKILIEFIINPKFLLATIQRFIGLLKRSNEIDFYGAEIPSVFIHPEFSGKGIGKMLINKTLGLGYSPIYLTVYSSNSRAIKLYKQMGFSEEKRFNYGKRTKILMKYKK